MIMALDNEKEVAQWGGADGESIAKMPHQKHAGSAVTKWKKNNRNQVEIETAMEGIFIEMHDGAKRQGNAKPK